MTMHSINESFATNMVGKTIKYDVQPYYRGEMVITSVTPRLVRGVREFSVERGYTYVTYECFDVEGTVVKGSETPSLVCGVPQGNRVMDGKTTRIVGCTFGDLYRATEKGTTIVKALCG